MRRYLVGLGILAGLLAAGAVLLAQLAAQAQYAGQVIASLGNLTEADSQREQGLFVLGYALETMIMPIALSAMLAVVALVAVLARAEQLRRST